MFAFMGIGRHFAQSEEGRARHIDVSPHTDLKRVDTRLFTELGVEDKTGLRVNSRI